PLVELLSANLDDSFRGIYPHLCGLDSSNAKSGVPFQGSDLVIDDCTHKTLPAGGCDHAVSATT
ncbi:hypothetical protein, partial [Escherichia coli]